MILIRSTDCRGVAGAKFAERHVQIGPEPGERLPDFSLPDQYGNVINFHADRGSSAAVIVFYRSAVW